MPTTGVMKGAMMSGNEEMIQLLLEKGVEMEDCHASIAGLQWHNDIVKWLAETQNVFDYRFPSTSCFEKTGNISGLLFIERYGAHRGTATFTAKNGMYELVRYSATRRKNIDVAEVFDIETARILVEEYGIQITGKMTKSLSLRTTCSTSKRKKRMHCSALGALAL